VTFEEARAAFPVLSRLAYLNSGTFGPLATATMAAMERYLRADLERGRGGKEYFDEVLERREQARARLADILGVRSEHVALTSSTSRGCSIVVAGLGLGPRDEIVTTDSEHFGLLGPLQASGARVRVARVAGRPAAEALEAVLEEVGPRTRLVAVSHVFWTTGNVLAIEELKSRVDVPLLVDGAQSVGAIPVDAEPFDFYTVSGQKWLCGPDATGALYVASADRLPIAAPSYFAQESYEPDGAFVPKTGAARFDSSWIPAGSLAGLLAALDAAPEWRFDRAREIAARCRDALLAAGVEVVTEPGQATLVTFTARGDPEEAAARAFDQGVVIRDLPGTPWLRASCGYWTSEEDIERLVAAVA
jgi:L-cysteine/cystine lyase